LQADLYASCVLMPCKLVFAAGTRLFSPTASSGCFSPPNRSDHPFVEIARFESHIPGAVTESDDQALDSFAQPFAEKFLVSPVAMRIRLEKLGLLHRAVPLQRLLSDGA